MVSPGRPITRLMKLVPLVDRIAKHSDIFRVQGDPVAMNLLVQYRKPQTVGKLVDDNEIADQQGRHHRGRRNLERLEQKRAKNQYQQQDRERTIRPPRPTWPVPWAGSSLARFPAKVKSAPAPRRRRWPGSTGSESGRSQYTCLFLVVVSQHGQEGPPGGSQTLPTCFIRRFPAFCFSSSLRLRLTSPP